MHSHCATARKEALSSYDTLAAMFMKLKHFMKDTDMSESLQLCRRRPWCRVNREAHGVPSRQDGESIKIESLVATVAVHCSAVWQCSGAPTCVEQQWQLHTA